MGMFIGYSLARKLYAGVACAVFFDSSTLACPHMLLALDLLLFPPSRLAFYSDPRCHAQT